MFQTFGLYYGSFYDGVSNAVYQISIQMPKHRWCCCYGCEEEAGLCGEEPAFPVGQPNEMRLRTRSEKLKSCFDQFLCISTVIIWSLLVSFGLTEIMGYLISLCICEWALGGHLLR